MSPPLCLLFVVVVGLVEPDGPSPSALTRLDLSPSGRGWKELFARMIALGPTSPLRGEVERSEGDGTFPNSCVIP